MARKKTRSRAMASGLLWPTFTRMSSNGKVDTGRLWPRNSSSFMAPLLRLLRSPEAILPVTPDKPPDRQYQRYPDHRVELVEVFPEFTPFLTKFHAEPCQSETPGPGSQERINMKAAAGHSGDSGGKSDECAYHGQQACNKHGQISPARKESVGPIEFAASHQNPASVAFDQRATPIAADFIGHERPKITADCAGRRCPHQLESALEDQIPSEGHNQLGRERDTC